MNYFLVTSLAAIVAFGCDTSSGKSTKTDDSGKDSVDVIQTTASPAGFVNGISDSNKGMKKGVVKVHGKFDVNQADGKTLFLYETEGSNYYKIDSTLVANQTFQFQAQELEIGVYKVALDTENNMASFIVDPDNEEVEINFKRARLDNSIYATSGENVGWFSYVITETRILKEIKDLKVQQHKSSVKAKFDPIIAKKEKELLDEQHTLIAEHPGTFLAKILTWKQNPHKADMGKFWSDLDFTDESLIHTPIIADRITDFMRGHSGGTDSGFINCIDITKANAEVNPRMLEFTLWTLLDGFYQTGKETICQYILDNYIYDEDCGADLSEAIKTKAQRIVNLQVGKTPPDFTIPSLEGSPVNLYDTVEKNEYTLVMFWASWCHKCEQEIPDLAKVYSQYKSKGFEVIGVSVDLQRNAWVQAAADKNVPWTTVSQLNGWKSPVAKDYKTTQTPAYFLLDKNKEIVLKPKRSFEVRNFLVQNLK